MNLEKEYENQQRWRHWEQYLEHIPYTEDDIVIDLGCSVGNVSRLFSGKVSKVFGIDENRDFIDYCKAKSQPNEIYIFSDISDFDFGLIEQLSGVWASFSLSYLKDPSEIIGSIYTAIKNGGWIALVDVSCFISGNMNKDNIHYEAVRNFEVESFKSGVYDFDFGSKMYDLLQKAGFKVIYQNNDVADPELNFNGAATQEILENWEARLARLKGLQKIFGDQYRDVCNNVLTSLSSSSRKKRENLKFVVGQKI